jgi:hypothetical protein
MRFAGNRYITFSTVIVSQIATAAQKHDYWKSDDA